MRLSGGSGRSTEKTVTRSSISNQTSLEINLNSKETLRLDILEKCADATRGLEAFDQYDWINSSDV